MIVELHLLLAVVPLAVITLVGAAGIVYDEWTDAGASVDIARSYNSGYDRYR